MRKDNEIRKQLKYSCPIDVAKDTQFAFSRQCELMDRVIQDLQVRGAKVKVIIEPLEIERGLRTSTWIIDAKWESGRHWQVTTIINDMTTVVK